MDLNRLNKYMDSAGGDVDIFETSVFKEALAMSKSQREALWKKQIVKTPGTLGAEGAWRLEGLVGCRLNGRWRN